MDLKPSITLGVTALRMQAGAVSEKLEEGHPIILTRKNEAFGVLVPLKAYGHFADPGGLQGKPSVGLSALRSQVALISRKVREGQIIVVTRDSKPFAVLMPIAEYESLTGGAG